MNEEIGNEEVITTPNISKDANNISQIEGIIELCE